MTDGVPAVQQKIDALQNLQHDKLDELEGECDVKRNAIYEARTKVLKAKGPKNFWSLVILTHPDVSGELAGPYDAAILESLTDFNVTFTQEGYKLTLSFSQNEYFENKALWVESVHDDLTFSGVAWKAGKGPIADDEDENGKKSSGEKRQREERGPSLFEVFEEMPPHPEDDEEIDEEVDDEEMEDMVADYEEEIADRKEVLKCFIDEIWADPSAILAEAAATC